MMLKSFGCSLIFGSELADAQEYVQKYNFPKSSQLTWPALLAQDLNMNYYSFAGPGTGNFNILEKVLGQASEGSDEIFVIGWTYIDRYDYVVDQFTEGYYDPVGTGFWKTIRPSNSDSVSKNYYQHIHNQFCDKFKTLIYIKCAIDTLKQKNIPFVMVYQDDLIFEKDFHTNAAIEDLQNYIRPYMTTFEGQTFIDWSRSKGFAISENMHPLEPAHQAAFELIKSYNLV